MVGQAVLCSSWPLKRSGLPEALPASAHAVQGHPGHRRPPGRRGGEKVEDSHLPLATSNCRKARKYDLAVGPRQKNHRSGIAVRIF